ncbi:hypothetical protein AT864_03135 [Anoxybacillus sp. P3H1B]|uniref:hypothetical protein n=1 Tax=Anoxybacillaceae TaxID=3120669 RepID=UPI000796250B|nr:MULTISPECIES: hypothetical protein [Anoxybacillus]KXG08439.1 hypothetical protein AT864_03135 [Anoxybacillus sp. P3H1B]
MEVTKEELSQVLSALMQQLIGSWTKEKIHSDVLEVIMKMRIDAGHEEEYMQLLLGNVAFATESTYALQNVLQTILTNQAFPTTAAVEAMMEEAQARIQDQLPTLIDRYASHFSQLEEHERKMQLERSYCAILLANRIKTDFIFSFIHEQNQEIMKNFFTVDPKDMLEAFHHLSGAYATLLLEGLELTY